jgi:hypothetical protein
LAYVRLPHELDCGRVAAVERPLESRVDVKELADEECVPEEGVALMMTGVERAPLAGRFAVL